MLMLSIQIVLLLSPLFVLLVLLLLADSKRVSGFAEE